MATKKAPLLSIGMIVKNEIRCIEKCLNALKPLRDAISCELVIADTGSTDGTREIVEQNADIFFDFEWIKDFSAARNAVMDKCTGTWYMTVDADEYLDADITQFVKFLKSKTAKQYASGFFTFRNYKSWDIENGEYVLFNANRLLRMDTGARYIGAIHEKFNLQLGEPSILLRDTIFHHDGYAKTTPDEVEKLKIKYARNMELLVEKLEKSPDDNVYLQCIESSLDRSEKLKYARLFLERVKSRDFNSEDNTDYSRYILTTVMCRAVSVLLSNNDNEAETWLEKLEELFPNSTLFNLDVAYLVTKYFSTKSDYEKVQKYAENYFSATDKLNAGKTDLNELNFSSLAFTTETNKIEVSMMLTSAYANSEQSDKAVEVLDKIDLDCLLKSLPNFNSYLQAIAVLCQHPQIVYTVARLFDKIDGLNDDNPNKKIAQNFFIQAINASKNSNVYHIFSETSGDYGVIAKILDALYVEELNEYAKNIQNWERVPANVIYKFMELNCDIPDEFFALPISVRKAITSRISTLENCAELLIDWAKTCDFKNSLTKIGFAYDCTASILAKGEHSEYQWVLLSRLWVLLSEVIATKIYSPEFIADINSWSILPSVHYFSLITLHSKKLIENSDEFSYIQNLRSALEAVPEMSNFISFLVDNGGRLFAPPSAELKAIAEQVKTILSTYPAHSAMVSQIKESEAYLKVAHLIEFSSVDELINCNF